MEIAGGPRGRLLVLPLLVFAAVVLASSPARAFYLPGVAPRDFQKVTNPSPTLPLLVGSSSG
jgi:transmembrane 9 superfamily protein 2/4